MADIDNLKKAIEELQNRLREEVQLRSDYERRCHLLEKLAYRDPSTGLRTETYMNSRVREEIERSIRYPSATTLVTVCAPETAEENLPQLGTRLADELRASDHVFSLEGKHGLALLLVETPAEGAHRVMERIGADLEQFVQGYGFSVTSFPVDANLADEFLQLAMERHSDVSGQLYPDGPDGSQASPSLH
jgi:hypothetical protein